MSEAAGLRDQVGECIETVQSEETWCTFDALRYSERLNVVFGTPTDPETGRRLSCQVEVIHPAFYFDPDRLVADEATLAETHPFLADFADDLSEAIASATGEDEIGPFVYRGSKPETAASSALFRTDVGRIE